MSEERVKAVRRALTILDVHAGEILDHDLQLDNDEFLEKGLMRDVLEGAAETIQGFTELGVENLVNTIGEMAMTAHPLEVEAKLKEIVGAVARNALMMGFLAGDLVARGKA